MSVLFPIKILQLIDISSVFKIQIAIHNIGLKLTLKAYIAIYLRLSVLIPNTL